MDRGSIAHNLNLLKVTSASFQIYTIPLANMGSISGLPHDQVYLLSLNTESNSTGFSFQPCKDSIILSMTQQKTVTDKGESDIFHLFSTEHNTFRNIILL